MDKNLKKDLLVNLKRVADKLQNDGETNLKAYEIAFQDEIERLVPNKSWWEVTDSNIFQVLFETRDIQRAIIDIISKLKADIQEEECFDIRTYEDIKESWNLDFLDEVASAVEHIVQKHIAAGHPITLDQLESAIEYAEIHLEDILSFATNTSKKLKERFLDNDFYDDDVFVDVNGAFGEVGEEYTFADIKQIWDEDHDDDPILAEYDSFDDWFEDTVEWLELKEGCHNRKNKKLKEAVKEESLKEDFDNIKTVFTKKYKGIPDEVVIDNITYKMTEYGQRGRNNNYAVYEDKDNKDSYFRIWYSLKQFGKDSFKGLDTIFDVEDFREESLKEADLTKVQGTLANAIVKHNDEIKRTHSKDELVSLMKNIIEDEVKIGPSVKGFIADLERKPTFDRALNYVYDAMLSGSGNRTISSRKRYK